MINKLRIVCIIPARLAATRFPRKMLAMLAGKPLLHWVWDAAKKVSCFDKVIIATDTPDIAHVVQNFGGEVIMTSLTCPSGTDRLVEVMKSGNVTADIWVDWQGDEPFINARMIQQLLQSCGSDTAHMWTLKKRITHMDQVPSPNVAKVVCDNRGFAMYFSY